MTLLFQIGIVASFMIGMIGIWKFTAAALRRRRYMRRAQLHAVWLYPRPAQEVKRRRFIRNTIALKYPIGQWRGR